MCLCNKHEAQASAYSILKDIFLILSPVRDRQLLLDSYSPKWPDRYESRHNSGTSFPILHFTWGPRPPLLPTCGCQSTSAVRPQSPSGSAASAGPAAAGGGRDQVSAGEQLSRDAICPPGTTGRSVHRVPVLPRSCLAESPRTNVWPSPGLSFPSCRLRGSAKSVILTPRSDWGPHVSEGFLLTKSAVSMPYY